MGPGRQPADRFHPDVDPGAAPMEAAYGGSLYLHLDSLPRSLNRALESGISARWVHYAVHDYLLHQDWETWELEPRLAESYVVEDSLVLRPGAAKKYPGAREFELEGAPNWRLYGEVQESEAGYRLVPRSLANSSSEACFIPREDVLSLERGSVFSFQLRPGVLWHDGHAFDAQDVLFSWECLRNPHVDAEQTRSLYGKLMHAEISAPGSIRFFYRNQFYSALETVGEMPILPRHLFDLNDPDLRAAQPEAFGEERRATPAEVGRFVNQNPHNQQWVGLGPYRLSSFDHTGASAERFEGYWDRDSAKYGGYVDRLIWRYIGDDKVAFQALLEGELDLFTRLSAEDFVGPATRTKLFSERSYKGYYYTGAYSYVAWNARKPYFEDPKVRLALAHLVDMRGFTDAHYQGLSKLISGPAHYFSKAYDHGVLQPAYDPKRAIELLEDAGWYDRDGDEIIDKDGVPFEFEFLHVAGKQGAQLLSAELQESLAVAGIKMKIKTLEFASLIERMRERDFDAYQLAWILDQESDPEQVWHSRWSAAERSSNFIGFGDAESDELIEAIQVELDIPSRMLLWRRLHRRIASLQPYLFAYNNPYKFAMSKRFRGMRTSAISPGYSVRQIYLPAGSPGTRPQPAR